MSCEYQIYSRNLSNNKTKEMKWYHTIIIANTYLILAKLSTNGWIALFFIFMAVAFLAIGSSKAYKTLTERL